MRAPARLLRRRVAVAHALWALLAVMPAPAWAGPKTMSCTTGSFAALSPAPARLIVPASKAAGSLLWSGTLSVSFSCSSTGSGAKLNGGSVVGGSSQTSMVSSAGTSNGVAMVSAGTPSITLGSTGCALNGLSEKAGQWTFGLASTAAGTCSGNLVAPLEFVRDTSALGSDIAASNPLGAGAGVADWIVFPLRKGAAAANLGLSGAVPLVAGGGCTVAPIALTVSLPTVSASALASPGSSAGATAFSFPLQSCQGIAATPYAVYASWSFTSVPGYPSVIANSASAGAAQVGVQILDASGTPVAGTPSSASLAGTVAASGGVASATYVARYFATGAVTPGAVTAVATYTLTYQ